MAEVRAGERGGGSRATQAELHARRQAMVDYLEQVVEQATIDAWNAVNDRFMEVAKEIISSQLPVVQRLELLLLLYEKLNRICTSVRDGIETERSKAARSDYPITPLYARRFRALLEVARKPDGSPYTLEEVLAGCQISQRHYQALRNGEAAPYRDPAWLEPKFKAWAEFFGVDVAYFTDPLATRTG